jgi:hypothetical protein
MKTNNKLLLLFIFIFALLVLLGCSTIRNGLKTSEIKEPSPLVNPENNEFEPIESTEETIPLLVLPSEDTIVSEGTDPGELALAKSVSELAIPLVETAKTKESRGIEASDRNPAIPLAVIENPVLQISPSPEIIQSELIESTEQDLAVDSFVDSAEPTKIRTLVEGSNLSQSSALASHIPLDSPRQEEQEFVNTEPEVTSPNTTPLALKEQSEQTKSLTYPSPDRTVRPSVNSPYIILVFVFLVVIIVAIVLYRKLQKANSVITELGKRLVESNARISDLGITDIESANTLLGKLQRESRDVERNLDTLKVSRFELKSKETTLQQACQKLDTSVANQKKKLSRTRELYAAIEHAVAKFRATDDLEGSFIPLSEEEQADLDTLSPTVMLNLNYMNYQDLRKEFRVNQKQIDVLLQEYSTRYTTKANQSIYNLLVISLRSELQNILYNLKYEKLDEALFQVQALVAKYLVMVTDGNQQIAGTIRKFIGELEHLFTNAVTIEYEYYIKKEQVRQEQLALRQQMREEAEERKRLQEQEKQVAMEESKYQSEIAKVKELLGQEAEDSPRRCEYEQRIEELQVQLSQFEEKKEEIIRLQNGKAGNVYIISNLGSFGDHVFKVGMTRRLDPQERVDELGSASVPFKFDVHSFIFSEDAVGLENEMHSKLHEKRLNKVNLRKEFFDVTLDELEQLVLEINPTAEFNRTMLADDYKQSLSMEDSEIPMADTEMVEQEEEDDIACNE